MKKLILILMVGSLFGDTIITSTALGQLSLTDVKFVTIKDGKVLYKLNGKAMEIKCSKVIKILDNQGNSIDYDCTKSEITYYNPIIEAGNNLVNFKNDFYIGSVIMLLGQLSLIYGTYNADTDLMLSGGGISFIGSLLQIFSFSKIGNAGEDLIFAGEKLEEEKKSN